jgi:DnaK suppressor protein
MQKVNGRSTTPTPNLPGQVKVLLAKKADLLLGFRGKLETFVAPENAAAEDLAPVSHDQSVALQLNQLEFSQLKLIDAALERIRIEEYGTCHDCGEPIPPRRLDAIPWAVRCVKCEEQFASEATTMDDDQLAA